MSLELVNILLDELYLAIKEHPDLSQINEVTLTPKQDMQLPALHIACREIKPFCRSQCQFFEIAIRFDIFSRLGGQHQNIILSHNINKLLDKMELNLANYLLVGKKLLTGVADTANDISTNKFSIEHQFIFKEVTLL